MAADAYYDPQGRRRIDRDHSRPDLPKDQRGGPPDGVAQLKSKVDALEKANKALEKTVANLSIIQGPGIIAEGLKVSLKDEGTNGTISNVVLVFGATGYYFDLRGVNKGPIPEP